MAISIHIYIVTIVAPSI